jgi:small subunit ribosomal protein S1
MKYDLRVVEVDPIHRRIILAIAAIPEDQPPRPETPSVVHKVDEEVPVEM